MPVLTHMHIYTTRHTHSHMHHHFSHFTAGPRPLDVFTKAYVPRVFMGLLFAAVVWWTARVGENGEFPFYYYVVLISVFVVHQVRIIIVLIFN